MNPPTRKYSLKVVGKPGFQTQRISDSQGAGKFEARVLASEKQKLWAEDRKSRRVMTPACRLPRVLLIDSSVNNPLIRAGA